MKEQLDVEVLSDDDHALFAPSAAHRWLNCIGFIPLSLEAPPQETSEAAAEGTLAHWYCERLLKIELRDYGTKPEKDRLLKSVYKEIKDPVMERNVKAFVAFVLEKRAKILAKYGKGGFTEFIEERVKYSAEHGGTVDYGLIANNIAFIADYKNGRHKVKAENNPQGKCYSLCLQKQFEGVEVFHFAIFQPNVEPDEDGLEYKMFKITKEELKVFERTVKGQIKKGNHLIKIGANKEDFVEGSWCTFCPCEGICPKKLELVEEAVNMLPQIEVEPVLGKRGAPLKDQVKIVDAVSPEQEAVIFKIWQNSSKIRSILEAAGEYMLHRAKDKRPVGDTKLVATAGRRGWREDLDIAAVKKVLKKWGVKNPTKESLIGIGEMEKALKDTDYTIDEFVVKSSGGYTVAEKDDPRPEYVEIASGLELLPDEGSVPQITEEGKLDNDVKKPKTVSKKKYKEN